MTRSLPSEVQAVIVGGGIVGCATAYHLARAGWKVALLERRKLTSGTTWHAAGLVSETQAVPVMTALARYGLDLMERLEGETGQNTGFRRSGSITLALSAARMSELRRKVDYACGCGVRAEEISIADAAARWPLLSTDGAVGAVWFPGDGSTNPIDTTMAMAKGARLAGASIFEDCKVDRVLVQGGRVRGVETAEGPVRAEVVVAATGMWSRDFALLHGFALPLYHTHHYYVVTDPIDGVTADLPVLRVMDEYAYYKADAGKLLIGCSEPNAKPWHPEGGIPDRFEFDELPVDEEHLFPILEAASRRVPALASSGIRKFFNGPESFTPDGRHYLGAVPEVKGLYVAAGFNSTGIQNGPGAGMALAEWIIAGHMTMDLTDLDVRRVHPKLTARSYAADKAAETLSLAYAMHWPLHQREAARGLRRSPYHDRQKEHGAAFGAAAGWERPLFYGARLTYGFDRQPWFEAWKAEHLALRQDLGMIDLTFGRLVIEGQGAETALQRLCTADVSGPPGTLVYTQMLNARGGIEADVTVARESSTRYIILASAGAEAQTEHWLRLCLEGSGVALFNATSSEATLAVMGPRARDFLQGLTDTDLSNAAFPFATFQHLHVGHAPARAQRITYVGELGWEIHVPSEFAAQAFEVLMAGGAAPRLCGGMSVDSCRLEKAFRHWGHDIGPADTPVQAGLTFTCDFSKEFLGRDAVLHSRRSGGTSRILQFVLDDPDALAFGKEPIRCNGEIAGRLTSASYGWTLGGATGLGYVSHAEGVSASELAAAEYTIAIEGRWIKARASLRPLYDPANARMRG